MNATKILGICLFVVNTGMTLYAVTLPRFTQLITHTKESYVEWGPIPLFVIAGYIAAIIIIAISQNE